MEDGVALVVGLIIGAVVGFVLGISLQMEAHRFEATSRGYGQYCADTGDWAWKGECQ